ILERPKALMKMGLSKVLVGHVNFLQGALVHGAVLRHINLNARACTVAYSISNVVALTTGLVVRLISDVSWLLFMVNMFANLLATSSSIGLTVSVVRTIVHRGRSLLTHCWFPDPIGYASITFDPTCIYLSHIWSVCMDVGYYPVCVCRLLATYTLQL
uniref:Transmembrane protein 54b n=1 Tax=Salmo trutta TaxID=8032 RepID=A0A673ZQR6_SALTR